MINYIKGYYVLVVEGIDTEKYLNFICKNRVPIYNVKRIDKTKVEFSVSRSDLKKIKNMYRGNKFEVKIKQKTGIPFLARRIYKYKTMVFSAIVSLLLLLSTTQFVTDIYIDCPEGIDKKVLKNFHDEILNNYIELFKEEKNALFRMKELWGYMIYIFSDNKKYAKKIKKAQKLKDYNEAVSSLFQEQEIIKGLGLFN